MNDEESEIYNGTDREASAERLEGRLKVNDMVITDEFVLVKSTDPLSTVVQTLLAHPNEAVLIADFDDDRTRVKGIVTPYNILRAIADERLPTDLSATAIMSDEIMEVNEHEPLDEILHRLDEIQPQAVVVTDDTGAFQGYFSPTDSDLAAARLRLLDE